MRVSYRRLMAGVLLFFAFIALMFFTVDRDGRRQGKVGGLSRSTSEKDPHARSRFEHMRLRSPRSGAIPHAMRRRELDYAGRLAGNKSRGRGDELQALSWLWQGPLNVGGRSRALAVDRANPDVLLAGGVSGGMWRYVEGQWRKSSTPDQLHSVSCIAQDLREGKERIWYYGTGELSGNSADAAGGAYRGDGLFRSVDGGMSWRSVAGSRSGSPHISDEFDYIWNIASDPSNAGEDELYVAAVGGIYLSTNGGADLKASLGNFANGAAFTDLAVLPDGIVYATLSSDGAEWAGLFRSEDGIAWENITPPEFPSVYRRIVIGAVDADEVYFLAETPGSGFSGGSEELGIESHSLWRYQRGGSPEWEDLSANLPAFGGLVGDFVSQSSYDLAIAVKPDDPSTVFIGGTNLYRSRDGFSSSSAISWIGGYDAATPDEAEFYPSHHPDIHAIVFHPEDPDVILSASDGGIHRSADCLAETLEWESLNTGYVTSQFYTVAIHPTDPDEGLVLGGMQDNGTWSYDLREADLLWNELGGGDGGFCAIAPDKRSLYISSQEGDIFRLAFDAEGEFEGLAALKPEGAQDFLFIAPFVFDPADDKVLYLAAGIRLWRNDDVSAVPLNTAATSTTLNWNELSNSEAGSLITAVEAASVPARRLYYGTQLGRLYRLDNARSNESIPVDITPAIFPQAAYINCIALHPFDGDIALVVFSNYEVSSLFATTDAGQSWTAIGGNLEEFPDGSGSGPSCRWAAIAAVGGTEVYLVATSTGLYSTPSLDGAATSWQQEGSQIIGNAVVPMVRTRRADDLVVAASHGLGVFSGRLVNPTAAPDPVIQASLEPAIFPSLFPNPSDNGSSLQFGLSEPADVHVRLHDVRGRTVYTTVSYDMKPGRRELDLDLAAVPDGLYFCCVRIGARLHTLRLLVRKTD